MIPPFSNYPTITAIEGRHDRIQLTIILGVLRGTTDSIDRMKGCLHPTEAMLAGVDWPTHFVFNRPKQNSQLVRSRGTVHGRQNPIPLFSGSLDFGGYRRLDEDEETHSVLKLTLNCNPTRFARFKMPFVDETPSYVPLGTAPMESSEEFSLDRNDNWILQGEQDDFCSPEHWMEDVRQYLNGIKDLVLFEIELASESAETQFARHDEIDTTSENRFALKTVETYYELASENPIQLVRTLAPSVKSFGAGELTRLYPPSEGHEGNAPCVTVYPMAGVILKVYAKTNCRIRIEITHDVVKTKRIIGGRHTTSTLDGIMEFLSTLREHAAETLNRFFTHTEQQIPNGFAYINEAHLLLAIGGVVQSVSTGLVIVESLRSRGFVEADNRSLNFRNALYKLRAKEILRNVSGTRRYIPTERFKNAQIRLQNRKDSLFPSRKRRVLPVAPLPEFRSSAPLAP